MTFKERLYLCVLVPFLSGCTSLTTEEPAPVTNPDSTVEEPDLVASAASGVEVEFVESAPKDRFVITNMGGCVLEDLRLELDLSQSAGMLIFDTSATGAGVDVFQPFEVERGDIVQLAADSVDDGDVALSLRIASLAPGDTASFTIDVDGYAAKW